MLYLVGPWVAVCAAALPARWLESMSTWRRSLAAAVVTFCVVDVLILSVTIVLPVNDRIALDRWLRDESNHGLHTVYALAPRKTGVPSAVTNSFYESGVVFKPITPARLSGDLSERPAFVYFRGSEAPPELAAIGCVPVFRTYPVWLTGSTLFRRVAEVETDSICRVDAHPSPPSR